MSGSVRRSSNRSSGGGDILISSISNAIPEDVEESLVDEESEEKSLTRRSSRTGDVIATLHARSSVGSDAHSDGMLDCK